MLHRNAEAANCRKRCITPFPRQDLTLIGSGPLIVCLLGGNENKKPGLASPEQVCMMQHCGGTCCVVRNISIILGKFFVVFYQIVIQSKS